MNNVKIKILSLITMMILAGSGVFGAHMTETNSITYTDKIYVTLTPTDPTQLVNKAYSENAQNLTNSYWYKGAYITLAVGSNNISATNGYRQTGLVTGVCTNWLDNSLSTNVSYQFFMDINPLAYATVWTGNVHLTNFVIDLNAINKLLFWRPEDTNRWYGTSVHGPR